MEWLSHIVNMARKLELVPFYFSHTLNSGAGVVILDVLMLLTLHGFYVLNLARIFDRIITKITSEGALVSILSYMVMIFLIVLSHVLQIIFLSIALDDLKIFADPIETFFYVSGMYTTIGSNSVPAPQWQILTMLISFCGLFAFSISGSVLFAMIGFFVKKVKKLSAVN